MFHVLKDSCKEFNSRLKSAVTRLKPSQYKGNLCRRHDICPVLLVKILVTFIITYNKKQ